jgi:mono/diheme cytochrome c family protein
MALKHSRLPASRAHSRREIGSEGVCPEAGEAGPLAALISDGRCLFAEPVGSGSKRSCASCHRKGGTELNALPLFGAAAAHPAVVGGKVMTLDDRISACFSEHLDEAPPCLG